MEYRYLLVVRFVLFNIVTVAALFGGYMEGWLDGMLAGPTLLMTLGIFGVFLFGLIVCGAKIWRTSEELNDIKTGMPPPETEHETRGDLTGYIGGGGAAARRRRPAPLLLATGSRRLRRSQK